MSMTQLHTLPANHYTTFGASRRRCHHKQSPLFVANRLAEIEWHSKVISWGYVPSKIILADEVIRDLLTQSL